MSVLIDEGFFLNYRNIIVLNFQIEYFLSKRMSTSNDVHNIADSKKKVADDPDMKELFINLKSSIMKFINPIKEF